MPDDFVGAVLGDSSSRRGRVPGTETAGHDRTVIKAEVPQVELDPLRNRFALAGAWGHPSPARLPATNAAEIRRLGKGRAG